MLQYIYIDSNTQTDLSCVCAGESDYSVIIGNYFCVYDPFSSRQAEEYKLSVFHASIFKNLFEVKSF
jgi:hypothetical protein